MKTPDKHLPKIRILILLLAIALLTPLPCWSRTAKGPVQLPVHRPEQITSETNPVRHMAVSADGRWLVYTAARGTGPGAETDLRLRSADPAQVVLPRHLTDDPSDKSFPAISPDGRQVAYVGTGNDVKGDLFLLDLGNESPEPVRLTGRESEDGAPCFSPDGKTLYFHQVRGLDGIRRIVAMDLHDPAHPVKTIAQNGAFPAVSPDGTRIAFVTFQAHREGDIHMIDLGTKQITRLTHDAYTDLFPAWSEDGADVLFSRFFTDTDGDGTVTTRDNAGIYRIKVGEETIPYPQTSAGDTAFMPKTGGGKLFFLSDRGGVTNAWALPAAGQIPPQESAEAQISLARHIASGLPFDPHLTVLAYYRVPERFRENRKLAAQAGYAIGGIYENAEMADAALWAFGLVQTRYGDVWPYGPMARISQIAVKTSKEMDGAGTEPERALAQGLSRLKAQGAEHDRPPVSAHAITAQARLLLKAGPDASKMLAMADALDRIIKDNGQSPDDRAQATLLKADLYGAVGMGDGIYPLYLSVVENYPDVLPQADIAVSRIIDLQLEGGISHALSDQVKRLRGIAQENKERLPRLSAGALNRVGDLYYAADEWALAKDAYRQVLEGFPEMITQTAGARLALAEILYREERFSQALALYEAEMAARPFADRIYQLARTGYIRKAVAAGDYLFRLGEVPAARNKFRELITYDSSIVEAHRGYIRSAAAMGDIKAVIADYRKKQAENPDDPVTIYATGLALTYSEDEPSIEEARKLLLQAAALDGRVEYFHQTLGYVFEVLETVYGKKGNLEKALESYKKAYFLNDRATNPRNAANLRLNLANAFFLLNQYRNAFRYYTQRLESDLPFDDPNTEILFYRRLGASAFQAREPERTIFAFQKAIELIDDHIDPKAASQAMDRINRYIMDRVVTPLIRGNRTNRQAEALRERQAGIHRKLYRLTGEAVKPPPSPEWNAYEKGMSALLAEQRKLLPKGAELARMLPPPKPDHPEETLDHMARRVKDALEFPPRLVKLKAEMTDRLGLAFQEAGEWEKGAAAFSAAFALNRDLGLNRNLARNRRSAAYHQYQLAGTLSGEARKEMLLKAAEGFEAALKLVEQYGVPEPAKKESGEEGLIGVQVSVAVDAGSATQAAYGFTKDQEIRLAQAFLFRIRTELDQLDAAAEAAEAQLAQYAKMETIPEGDRYGVALLYHRAGHLAAAGKAPEKAFDRFMESAEMALSMKNAVSALINTINLAHIAENPDFEKRENRNRIGSLFRLKERTSGLVDRELSGTDPVMAARYHNTMGVHIGRMGSARAPSPSFKADPEAAGTAMHRRKEAGVHFLRGIEILNPKAQEKAEKRLGRDARGMLAALRLNLAGVAEWFGDDPAPHYQRALEHADAGGLLHLKWRALAGLGELEPAIRVLESVTVTDADAAPGQIVGTFAPLVARAVNAGKIEEGFNLAERIFEIERYHRMAFLLGNLSGNSASLFAEILPRVTRIRDLEKALSGAQGEEKGYLEEQLEGEKGLLAKRIGADRSGLPDLYRIADEKTAQTMMILTGLALEADAGARRGDFSVQGEKIEAYQRVFKEAVSERSGDRAMGPLALFGPIPADALSVMAALQKEERLAYRIGLPGAGGAFVRFEIGANDLHGEIMTGESEAVPCEADYIAGNMDVKCPAGEKRPVRLWSGTHLVRSVSARKPFRREILSIPSIPSIKTPPQGYTLTEDPKDAHTLILLKPLEIFSSVPTRAGELPERYPAIPGESGKGRIRLENLFTASPELSLGLMPRAAPEDRELISQLAAIYGLPSLVLPEKKTTENFPAGPFLQAYREKSAAQALADAADRGWTLMGYRGMDAEKAAAYAKANFAGYIEDGRAAYGNSEFARALGLFENAIRIAQEMDAFAKYLPALYSFGRESAYRAEESDRAIRYAKALSDLYERAAPDSKEHAEAVLRLGILYAQKEEYEAAVPLLETAAEMMANLDLGPEQAAALASLGVALENATDYDRALTRFQSAASLSRDLAKDELLAQQQTNIGRIYDLRLSQYAVAIKHYEKALGIHRDMENPQGRAQALLDMGRCYRLLGNFSAADGHYEKALEITNAGKDTPDDRHLRAKIIIEQANNAWYQARYEEAFTLQREAFNMAESFDWPLMEVITRNTGGLIWWTLGDYDRALGELSTALEAAEELVARDDEIATTLNNMGQVLREMGRNEEALEKFRAALEIDRRIGSRWAIAHDLRNQAQTLLKIDRAQEALPLFQQAAEVAASIGNRINEARCRVGLGDALRALGQGKDAEAAYGEALKLSTEMALREMEWRSLYGLALLRLSGQDREGAAEKLFGAVDVIERMRADIKVEGLKESFIINKLDVYETLVTLLSDMGRIEAALETAERSRSRNFIDLLGNQRLSLGGTDGALYERQQTLKARIEEHETLLAQSESPEEKALYRKTLDRLVAELDDLMIEMQTKNPQLASMVSISPLSASKIIERVEPGTALLVYYAVPEEILCWAVRKDGIRLFRTPVGRKTLAESLLDYRRMIQNLEPLTDASEELYGWLIAPVEKALSGAKTIGIIPHNALHYLSFAAITDGDRFLIERYPIFYLPSASLLEYTLSRRQEGKNMKVLAVGNPDLKNPALELPFAEYEVGSIRWNFPDITILTHDRATEDWVVANIGDFGIIHIASHGEFNPVNPLFSALKLAKGEDQDGDLAAAEIFGLKVNADMVVLSACQTGLGKVTPGDDVIGLNRAFFYAGTHTLISSLWRVSDVSTAILIREFYREYVNQDKARSLRQAILHVKARYPHPGYWAPFTLVGDYY